MNLAIEPKKRRNNLFAFHRKILIPDIRTNREILLIKL